ncbi:MAG: hypothetical protein BZ135_02100, partial [Methanosphaera sp. rholeuAM6]
KAIIDYGSKNTVKDNVNVSTTKYYGTVYLSGTGANVQKNIFKDSVPKVTKATVVTVSKVSGTVGETIKLTATVKSVDGTKVTGGTVVFKINGKTLKTTDTISGNANSRKVSVKNGVATYSFKAPAELSKMKNISATYSGTDGFASNKSAVIKSSVALRNATLSVSVNPSRQQQYKTITFTAKIIDVKTGKAVMENDKSYVIFKINGKTLKDSKGNEIKTQVKNGVATYNYVVPAGMAGYDKDNNERYYTVSSSFYGPEYNTPKQPSTKFTVARSSINVDTTKVAVNTTSKQLRIEAKIKDYKGNVILGESHINIKVNGKTVKYKGQMTTIIENGKIAMTLNLGNIQQIDSVTIVVGASSAYGSYRNNVTFTRVK